MGVALNLIPLLIDAVRLHRVSGSFLMLGRQDVEANPDNLRGLFEREAFFPRLAPDQWKAGGERITPEPFFRALGFSSVESLDVSDSEGASIVFDLNASQTPPELVGRCDVLFDGGTLEHVFHLPNALARCTDIIKPGGWFVHIGPLNNYADHGFYQFSSTFWFDWFAANGWTVVESVMVRLPSYNRPDAPQWTYSFLPPDRLGRVGALDDAPYMHFLIARKDRGAVSDRIPMQAFYAKKYAGESREERELRAFEPFAVTSDGRRIEIKPKPPKRGFLSRIFG